MKIRLSTFLLLAAVAMVRPGFAETSEIMVNLKLDNVDYVVNERIRAVVDIVNLSPDTINVGLPDSPDRFFVEVYRARDREQIEPAVKTPFVADFLLESNEGQKLETFIGDHFALKTTGRYLAKPVLVHGGTRYEGQPRAFDVVPGMAVASALQMFSNHEDLRREFELVYWNRKGRDHLFIKTKDFGAGEKSWATIDLGAVMKITKPTVSILPTGEVVVFHRVDADNFLRSEFWSVPQGLEFHSRNVVQDPETAGANRVRELYKESGGIKPKENPWWKFW